MMVRRFIGCLAALLAMVGSASSGSIGVNFTGGAHLLAAADQPGVVPGANWINVIGGSGTNPALLDNSATPTTARLTFSSTGDFDGFSGTSTPNAATSVLYQGGLFGNNVLGEVHITLTNIPYARCDVYVYASADTFVTNTLSDTNGATTFYYASDGRFNSAATSLLQTTNTNPASPTTGPGQYQLFSGQTGATFTLTTAGSISGVISNNVFGLQIVETPTAVPEPASLTLLGLGVADLAGCSWKRKRAA
jgi:hypothetical protein